MWLIIGYFNLIYRAEDKNNDNLDFRLMGLFRRALTNCQLKELKLQNRKYTWSNERETPTLVRLDRAFCNAAWDPRFKHLVLHALSSSLSDHCQLLLSNQSGPRKPPVFRFESFWTNMPGFTDVFQKAWSTPSSHSQPVHVINHKLKTTVLGLRAWSKGLFSDCKLQLLWPSTSFFSWISPKNLARSLRRKDGSAPISNVKSKASPLWKDLANAKLLESATSVKAMLIPSSSTFGSVPESTRITS
ncbi:uncharacterized protein [Lolium perenne]|uniref:uncharacterized protein n=1 Tax=Lolium perenne TaxID=4522 RepID=UPI003A997100